MGHGGAIFVAGIGVGGFGGIEDEALILVEAAFETHFSGVEFAGADHELPGPLGGGKEQVAKGGDRTGVPIGGGGPSFMEGAGFAGEEGGKGFGRWIGGTGVLRDAGLNGIVEKLVDEIAGPLPEAREEGFLRAGRGKDVFGGEGEQSRSRALVLRRTEPMSVFMCIFRRMPDYPA